VDVRSLRWNHALIAIVRLPLANPVLSRSRSSRTVASKTRALLKTVYLQAARLRDRVSHPRRHSLAMARLRAMKRPRQILVVCHGNICRSPYFQAVLQKALPDVAVSSAGFIAAYRSVPPQSLEVSGKRGYHLEGFRSRLLSSAMVRAADLIVVMEPSQGKQIAWLFGASKRRIVNAGDLDPNPGESRIIADPWMKPVSAFETTFDRLDRCAQALVSALRGAH